MKRLDFSNLDVVLLPPFLLTVLNLFLRRKDRRTLMVINVLNNSL